MSVFGDFVRLRREELDLDQSGLARQLGVNQQTVSRWEVAKAVPRPDRIGRLAEVLRVEVADLMRYAGYLPESKPTGAQADETLRRLLDEVSGLTNEQLVVLIDHAWVEYRDRLGFSLQPPRRHRSKPAGM